MLLFIEHEAHFRSSFEFWSWFGYIKLSDLMDSCLCLGTFCEII